MNVFPDWKHHRAIHSRFPPTNLFDAVFDGDSLLLMELEGETSDRLMRWRERVTEEDARFGQGWGAVMASFCYARAGRFNTESLGAYYCADSAHTAISEWSHHAAHTWNEFGYGEEASATIRIYTGKFEQPLVDARRNTRIHKPGDYTESQAFAQRLWRGREYGLLYRSVRRKDGQAAALLRPPATSPVAQAGHYSVRWDGQRFVEFAKMSAYEKI